MSTVNLKISKLATNKTQAVVLKAVRDNAPVSRSGIVKLSKLPLPAVSRTVSRLIEDNILIEKPHAVTDGPRRKRGLSLNGSAGHCLSVHYHSTGLEGVILDTAYNILIKESRNIPLEHASRDTKIKTIIAFIRDLQDKVPASAGPCLALAVVDPGVVEETSGTVLLSSTMYHWTEVPIVEIFQKQLPLPVILLSTSLATIRAIDRLELKSSADNLIYIEYEEGIGCGLKLQGNYIAGKANLAGEFGHIRVTEQNISCRCGAVGCLEAVATLPVLVRHVNQAMHDGSNSVLNGKKDIDGLSVLKAAARGDRLASRVVHQAFDYLGHAVGGLVNILAPEIVMFDSMIGLAGSEAVSVLTQSVKKSVLPSHLSNVDLRISTLKSHIGCLGGAVAGIDQCLEY